MRKLYVKINFLLYFICTHDKGIPDNHNYTTLTTPCSNHSCFNCENEYCIPWLWVCDNDPDCHKGNDEAHDLCKYSGSCGGNFTVPEGILTSPSYPDSYPYDMECVYTITQPPGTVILLSFVSMDITNMRDWDDPESSTHYLEIRDGAFKNSSLIIKVYGHVNPAPIRSSKNYMWIK